MRTLCFFAVIFLLSITVVRAANPVVEKIAACSVTAASAAVATAAHTVVANNYASAAAEVEQPAARTTIAQSILSTRDVAVARWKSLLKTAVSARFAWMWLFVVLLGAKRL